MKLLKILNFYNLIILLINTKIGRKKMKILDLFDMYFLTMMLIQGTVVLTS